MNNKVCQNIIYNWKNNKDQQGNDRSLNTQPWEEGFWFLFSPFTKIKALNT